VKDNKKIKYNHLLTCSSNSDIYDHDKEYVDNDPHGDDDCYEFYGIKIYTFLN
jgi:hypothetical protein